MPRPKAFEQMTEKQIDKYRRAIAKAIDPLVPLHGGAIIIVQDAKGDFVHNAKFDTLEQIDLLRHLADELEKQLIESN